MTPTRDAAYRCRIPEDLSAATIKVGRRQHNCRVLYASRDAFYVALPKGLVWKVCKAKKLELRFHDELWLVGFKSDDSEEISGSEVSLSRIQELTKFSASRNFPFFGLRPTSVNADPTFVLMLVLAILAACVCLPGLGDSLGTAPKVQRGIEELINSIKDSH